MGRSRRSFRDMVLMLSVFSVLSGPAAANNIAWKNPVNGSWHTAANWLPAQVPGPSDVALINVTGTYTVSINSDASVGAVGLTGGTGTRRLHVNGATLTTSTGIAVAASNYLTLNSGTLSGAGTIDVTGNLTSSGNSAINSPVTTHSATAVSVAGDSLKISSSFQNLGTFQLLVTNPVFLFVNGTLTNTSTGTIQVSGAGGFAHLMQGSLNNQGTVTVPGTLGLEAAGASHSNSGTITINPGGTLRVQGGSLTVGSGSVTGNGALALAGGATANFSVFPQLSALSMQNATATFPGILNTNDTSLDLDSSNLTGYVRNAAGHTVHVTGSVIQGTVENAGTLDVHGISSLLAFLDNEGLLTIHDGLYLSSGDTGQLNNGIVHVLGGTLLVVQTAAGYFSNQDSLSVSPGATVQVIGGTFRNETGGVLAGGGACNVVSTTFLNYGMITPGASPGRLTVSGDVTLESTSVLNMELGGVTPGTGYDQVQISGNVALNGTLNVSLVGGYFPEAGQAFDLVTCASHSGQFTAINGTALGSGTTLAFVPQTRASDPIRLTTVGQTWTSLAPGAGPAIRSRHVSAYDSFSNRLIVFGGFGSAGELNDTWVLTHANGTGGPPAWQQLSIAGSPPPVRQGHAAAYDVTNNRLIVYGGYSAAMTSGYSDVWVLSHANGLGGTATWTQLAPGGGTPGARVGGGVGYNPASNRLILFGGVHPVDACTFASNDVWILTNANGLGGAPVWSLLPTSGLPPYPRSGAVLAYDDASNRLVLHAGTDACAAALGEARYLTHADGLGGTPTWTTLPLTNPTPPARTDHAGFYDAMTDRLVTFGGLDAGGTTPLADVFLVTGATNAGAAGWSSLPVPAVHPAARVDHSLSWDPRTRRAILFGGDAYSEGLKADVWILDLDIEPGSVSGVGDPAPPEPGFGVDAPGFLKAPWPNPTNGPASLTFVLPAAAQVSLDVFDVSGRRVRELFRGTASQGLHEVRWNGDGDRGPVPSGVYYVVIRSGTERDTRRIVVSR